MREITPTPTCFFCGDPTPDDAHQLAGCPTLAAAERAAQIATYRGCCCASCSTSSSR